MSAESDSSDCRPGQASYVPLLMKPATYHSGQVCLFLWSLLVFCVWGPVSDYIQEVPEEAATQVGKDTKELGLGKEASMGEIPNWP